MATTAAIRPFRLERLRLLFHGQLHRCSYMHLHKGRDD